MRLFSLLLAPGLAAGLALPAAAQLPFTETFDGGSNTGGWTLGVGSSFPNAGGNPGAYLHSDIVDTFAPQPRSSGSSVFTGNWRAQGVAAVGIDLRTFFVQFPFDRELSLILSDTKGTNTPLDDDSVYFLGTRRVPQIAEGWRSFDFYVDTQSTVLPLGWQVLQSQGGGADAVWNQVVTNVGEVRFFYGDPTNFFIFDQWQVGLDNARIAAQVPTSTYCVAQVNSQGCTSNVALSGVPSASSALPFTISAPQVINQKAGLLFYGFGPNNAPFLGGTLCVAPPLTRTGVQFSGGNNGPDDCSGLFQIDFNAWIQSGIDPALVAGESVFGQYWHRDPAAGSTTGLSDAAQFAVQP
jgi:hypothetical protein